MQRSGSLSLTASPSKLHVFPLTCNSDEGGENRSHRKFRKQNHSLLIRLRIKTFQKCLLQITILEAVFSVRSSNNLNSMIHNKVSNIPLPMKMNFWLFMFAKEEINLALSFDFFHTEKSLFSTILDTEKCKKRQGTIN